MTKKKATPKDTNKKKTYYLLHLSESTRLDTPFESKEEVMSILESHIEEHNRLVADANLHFNISDFALVEE